MTDFNERRENSTPETAVLVHPVFPLSKGETLRRGDIEDRVDESAALARAIFLDVVETKVFRLSRVNPGTLMGKGACEDVAALVAAVEPAVVIVDCDLSPVQQRNLERAWEAKVIDRTGLILEIFGERAQTKEGRIQVELAALEYQKSRLVRSWTHLERQRGGAGFMGGPGERQIELDRRIITDKITRLKKDLEKVRKTRELGRKSRERVPYPIVALVGYTNAGKSTLFNKLTGAGVFAKDLLFATLDPTMRKVALPKGRDVILSDTVGFIADLPHGLVAAFRATLEQVQYADVILHVRDMAREDCDAQRAEVISILEELGIEYDSDPRVIEVLNKIDALNEDARSDIARQEKFNERCIALSALSGEGTDALLRLIESHLAQDQETLAFNIPPADGEAISWLYEHGHVVARKDDVDAVAITVDLDPVQRERFKERFSYEPV